MKVIVRSIHEFMECLLQIKNLHESKAIITYILVVIYLHFVSLKAVVYDRVDEVVGCSSFQNDRDRSHHLIGCPLRVVVALQVT